MKQTMRNRWKYPNESREHIDRYIETPQPSFFGGAEMCVQLIRKEKNDTEKDATKMS